MWCYFALCSKVPLHVNGSILLSLAAVALKTHAGKVNFSRRDIQSLPLLSPLVLETLPSFSIHS